MRLISETSGIAKLAGIRRSFADEIRENFEHRAKPCLKCETPGACCLDEHFVNVRVTRLEAKGIWESLRELGIDIRQRVYARATAAIERYRLDEPSDRLRTYSCPLFEKGIGCLVHDKAKPLPCIAHACYEREADLPPESLLFEREAETAELNRRVYGKDVLPMPIPLAITRSGPV